MSIQYSPKLKSFTLSAFAIGFLQLGMSPAANAEELSMVFENNSKQDVLELYVSPTSDYSNEENLLGTQPLKPTETIDVLVTKTRKNCIWSVSYKLADGLQSSESGLDLCSNNQSYLALGGFDAGTARDSSGEATGNCNWEKEGTEVGQLMEKKYGGEINPESDAIAAGMVQALKAAMSGDVPKACDIYADLRKKMGE